MKELKFKIEKALVKDSGEILRLLNSSHNLTGYRGEEFTMKEIKDYIREKRNLVIISKFGKKIIGVSIATFWKEYCYLYLFIVHKDYRNLGVGGNMMEYLERKAMKEGYVGLFVKENNIEMINLIKKRKYLKGEKFIYFHKVLK